jgi:hypothetical protein
MPQVFLQELNSRYEALNADPEASFPQCFPAVEKSMVTISENSSANTQPDRDSRSG